MAYDSATTAAVAAELRERLPGGRVDKIIQPSTFAVALLIRAGGANHWLMLSAHPQHARVALSAARLAGAFDEPSPFVMLLRKHLDGARLAAALAARPDDAPLAQALVDVLAGVSPQLAREVAYRLAGGTAVPLGAQRAKAGAALDVLRALLAPDRWQPGIVRRGGKIVDWAAYPLLQHGVEPERCGSISA